MNGNGVLLAQHLQRGDVVVVLVRDEYGVDGIDIHANVRQRADQLTRTFTRVDENTGMGRFQIGRVAR